MTLRNGGNGITAKEAIEAAQGSKGFVTQIAKQLGCSRRYVYTLMNKYSTFQEAIKDEREQLKDFAESKLFRMIDNEVPAAVFFYLKTQAKDRGYIESQLVQNINIDVTTLSDNELERIANGEDPISAISSKS